MSSKKPKKINADRVVSISAIIVSVATLLMIVYQTNLSRKEQKASVMPSLSIGYSLKNEEGKLREAIWISNKGLGPAFVEKVVILSDGKKHETDPYGFLYETSANSETTYFDRIHPGTIISPNDGITTYEKATDSTSHIILSKFFEFPQQMVQWSSPEKTKAVIEITYKSVYGDRWKVRSDDPIPVKLN